MIGAPTAAATSLVGRHDELAMLERFVDAVTRGPASCLVEGEAGIGKTVLLDRAIDEARRNGVRVLVARPAELEARFAYAGLGDLLRGVVTEVLPSLPEPQRRALVAALLLEEPDAAIEPGAVAAAVLSAIRLLAEKPLLVVVDDVQWLDDASLGALGFAARRVSGERVGLLFALRGSRGGSLPSRLRTSLPGALERVSVGPLSVGALRELLRAHLGTVFPRPAIVRIHEASGGNPFFALELARRLPVDEGEAGLLVPVPDDLSGLVRERLGRLPFAARSRLLLAATAATPNVTLLGALLDPILEAGIVVREGDAVRFAHPLFAEAVLGWATPAERRGAHREAARLEANEEQAARHLALAADRPSEDVAARLEAAARKAHLRGAVEEAGELARLAATLTPASLRDRGRERASKAADYFMAAGVHPEARTVLAELIENTAPGRGRALLLTRLADAQAEMTRDLVTVADQAVAEAADDPLVLARAYRTLAHARWWFGELEQAALDARLSTELAAELGDAAEIALAEYFRGWVDLVTTGRVDEAALRRAAELAEDDPGIRAYFHPNIVLAAALRLRDRLEEARPLLARQYARAVATGDGWSQAVIAFNWAMLELQGDDLDRATELAVEARERLGAWGHAYEPAGALYVYAHAAAFRGHVEEARAAVALSSEQSVHAVFRTRALAVLGFLELSLGDPVAAATVLRRAHEELLTLGHVGEPGLYPILPNLIEALVVLGELDEARSLLGRLTERGRTLDHPWALALGARCRALIAAAAGDEVVARVAFGDALDAHRRLAGSFERGRTLLALGAFERRHRRRREARAALAEAIAIFDRLSTPLWLQQAKQELAALGGRTPAGASLTAAERRVAELVSAGLANKEIAARLVLTVNTVEKHLTRIYAKLGVRSRTELAVHLRDKP